VFQSICNLLLPPSLLLPQALSLQNNAIEALPMSFVNLSNLTSLDLGGNKMQGLPPNVLQGGPQALLQFMRYNYRYDNN
jgi:Leucine-rich repeat (LRR) protein